ncbi:MAG: hypothetical protein R6U44_10105 [Archaeoglobaceae archaeon]
MRGIGLVTKMVVPVGIVFIIILTALHGGSVWLGVFQVDIISQLIVFPNFLYPLSVILGFVFVISLVILIFMRIKRQDNGFPQKLVSVLGIAFVVCSAAFIGVFWWSASQHQAKSIHIIKMESLNEADCRDLSSSQLNHYPAIKEAIEREGDEVAVNVSLSEISRLRGLGDCIEVGGKYYGVKLYDILIAKEVAAEGGVSVGELPFLEQELATIYEGSYAKSSARIRSMPDDARYRMDRGGTQVILPDGFVLTNVTLEELVKAREFDGVIKYNGSYYRVYVDCKLLLNKDYSLHPACTNVSEKELRDHPALKQDLERASEEGSATISDLPEGWSNCIKYNESYYKIRIAMA